MEDSRILAWFLGPKSENAPLLEEMLLLILRDYCHWRRNYFPGDMILNSREMQRELEPSYDKMYQGLLEMIAELRRNFPFYSPRYLGHMLSDTLLTSTLGYFAGMLYNANNVTPEAAPVTVDMEIEACNRLLYMLGHNTPPAIPKDFTEENIEKYKKSLQNEFGWAHLTFGGTTANLEALWVARAVRYTALSIWDIAKREKLDITVKFPNGKAADLKRLKPRQVLLIKPNEAIYLLARYVDAFRMKQNYSIEMAGNKAYDLLRSSQYSVSNGYGKLFTEFPPVVFVSGTAHYSIQKSADILGIGQGNVVSIPIDSAFRMDVKCLEENIRRNLARDRIPLSVVTILGTTEEGAVDPVHRVVDLRNTLEAEDNISFWLHIDAAWGGYMRSVFNLSRQDELMATLSKISKTLDMGHYENAFDWNDIFIKYIENNMADHGKQAEVGSVPENGGMLKDCSDENIERERKKSRISGLRDRLNNALSKNSYDEYLRKLTKLIDDYRDFGLKDVEPRISLDDRMELVNEFISDVIELQWGDYRKDVQIKWGSKEVCSAFMAIGKADSVTIDPHKMGYAVYPCGMIAFKNDRARHFILQKAPYITSAKQHILVHMPPRHIDCSGTKPKIVVEAFAPFIVEGSRPGAVAASLLFTMNTIPPTMNEHGIIVKASLLAAREFYEWIVHWNAIMVHNKIDIDYQFIPLSSGPPDTNIVIFVVKKRTSNSVEKMNKVTESVYEHFTIQAELGEREYSYAQPYFLSKTTLHDPVYSFETIRGHLEKHFDKGHLEQAAQEYKRCGLTVLRATLMNPFIRLSRLMAKQSVLKEFMTELSSAAERSVAGMG
jgi:glutamate/tyrosine decarboxylase-like PLP-dependent enzyme